MRMTVSAGLALALALSACSREPTPAASESATTAAPSPTSTVSPQTAEAGIPTPFQGRWGLVAEDCTSTRGDAKGLLEVGPSSLKFYESVANLTAIIEAGRENLLGTFTFTGEGQTWTASERLTLEADGKVLIRVESGTEVPSTPYRYTRCAN